MYFAKSTNGFYDPRITAAASMPTDAVQISDATYHNLLAGQATGQMITGDANGYPVLSAPVLSATQQQELLRRQAQAALELTDRVALRCLKAAAPFPAAWHAYTQALRAIVNGTDTASTSLPAQPPFPAGT